MNNLVIRILGTDICPIERIKDMIDIDLGENSIYRSQFAILLVSGNVTEFINTYGCSTHNIWLMDYVVRDVLSNAPVPGYIEGIYATFHKELNDFNTFSIDSITKHEDGVTFEITDKLDEPNNQEKWRISVLDCREIRI